MTGGNRTLVIQTQLHRRGWWILVPLTVTDGPTIEMVLDTGSLLSAISDDTQAELGSRGLLETRGERRFILRQLSVQGQTVPDLVVRPSRRVTQAGARGVLGLDFLGRFTDIHFHVPTMRLTLTY